MDHARRRTLELIAELAEGGAGLGPGAVDRSTPLEALGIDSLAATELAFALEEELGVALLAELRGSLALGELLELVGRAPRAAGASASSDRLPGSVGRLQGLARALGGRALRWWLDLRVEGSEHVPERGPAILAMNHESALDIPVAVIACPRRVTFMAKRELFGGPFTSWALERLGAFRVVREAYDLRAIRLALDVLRRGGVLGMYPEGTRAAGELLPFLLGSAWLALRTGAPLVPTAISGTELAARATRPKRVRVRVRFGGPIAGGRVEDPAERLRRAAALTDELRSRVARLLRVD